MKHFSQAPLNLPMLEFIEKQFLLEQAARSMPKGSKDYDLARKVGLFSRLRSTEVDKMFM